MTNLLFSKGRKDSCYSVPTLGNPWTYFKQGCGYKVFQLLVTWYMNLLTFSYSLQYAKRILTYYKLNDNVELAGWVINWAMWTQHNLRVSLGVFGITSKGCFCQFSRISRKFIFRVFLYLNPWTVYVIWNWYCAHTLIKVTGKIEFVPEIDLVYEDL